ncbi:MAG: hypothetical protein WCK63_13620 [Betaproteobacteria bacterium]
MIEEIFIALPTYSSAPKTRRIVFPDGNLGVITFVANRKGPAGSISYISTKCDDEENVHHFLLVMSVIGTNIISVPELAADTTSQDPIAETLADREILGKVINLFPSIATRTFSRTERPDSSRPVL